MEQKTIDLPPPPNTANAHNYYFIYGEWTQVYEQSSIATADNPNPSGGLISRQVGINECIAMHPVLYYVLMQSARPGYTIKWATGIDKALFDWYKEIEKRVNKAIAKAREGGPNEKQEEVLEEVSTEAKAENQTEGGGLQEIQS